MSSTHHSIPIISQLSHHPTKLSTPSSLSLSLPRLTNRKNHLRSKILKTLKPYQNNPSPLPQHQPQPNPIILADPVTPFVETNVPMMPDLGIREGDHGFEEVREQEPFVESGVPILPELRVGGGDRGFEEALESGEEVAVGMSLVEGWKWNGGLGGMFSGASGVVKCGFYVAGFFITVWLMSVVGRYEWGSEGQRGNSEAGFDESVFYEVLGVEKESLGDEKMAEKIDEIRRMAREVRAKEGRIIDAVSVDPKDSGEGDNDGDADGHAGHGSKIGDVTLKDVDPELRRSKNRLVLNGMRKRSSDADARTELGEMGDMKLLDFNKRDNMFIFKKQYAPVEFIDSDYGSVARGRYDNSGAGSGDVDVRDFNPEQKFDGEDSNDEGSGKDSTLLESSEDLGAPIVEKKHTGSKDTYNGSVAQCKYNNLGAGLSLVDDEGLDVDAETFDPEHKELKNMKAERIENKKQKLQDSKKSPDGVGVSQKNDESNPSQPRSKTLIGEDEDKSPDGKPERWWLNLPYVIAIQMQKQNLDDQGSGLYCLKGLSKSPDEKHSDYIIAFEDRLDAENFCDILETTFADIEDDTSVDVVPLPVKELSERVESGRMNIFVVKKQRLQLYAGQPLAEVEARLYKLVTS
ncbi:hypothetical protein AKJ16_DCAP19902 [Drosera capensis]